MWVFTLKIIFPIMFIWKKNPGMYKCNWCVSTKCLIKIQWIQIIASISGQKLSDPHVQVVTETTWTCGWWIVFHITASFLLTKRLKSLVALTLIPWQRIWRAKFSRTVLYSQLWPAIPSTVKENNEMTDLFVF